MATKPQSQHPEDDWAGLAQNLFGIDLESSAGDDDLLDDDMFKVELPKPPEEPTPTAMAPATVAEVVSTAAPAEIPAAAAVTAPPAPTKPVQPKKPAVTRASEDAFGAGLEEFGFGVVEETPAEAAIVEVEIEDAGLTLPEDYDSEGLTLASDFDDGLTLPPDSKPIVTTPEPKLASAEEESESEEDEAEDVDDEESDLEDEGDDSEVAAEEAGERPRRRRFRRTREDAYWDLLENWQWEEIPADDAPRAERPRSGGFRDRRGRGDRPRRDDRRREERPRDERPARDEFAEEKALAEGRAPEVRPDLEERPARGRRSRDEQPRSDQVRSTSGDRPRRTRDEDRERGERRPRRDDREPRAERGRSERPRDERAREDRPREAAAPRQPSRPPVEADSFGLGIFDDTPPSSPVVAGELPREDAVAQSTQAADSVVRPSRTAPESFLEELVWPEEDSDSDVRPARVDRLAETDNLPTAEGEDESEASLSDESDVVPLDDVVPLEESDEARPRRRRRRRRRGPRPDAAAAPVDGNEGTTFDLSEALADSTETPDFIPEAEAGEPTEFSSELGDRESDDQAGEAERRGRRRRRRRRRPESSDSETAVESSTSSEPTEADEISFEEEAPLPTISYANIPSWEEAIRYLLQPHLVGRNLTADEEFESLEGDPRGSGGSEPTPPPPPRRRRGGGGNSGGRYGRRDSRSGR